MININETNGGSLAYIGDAVWSLMVREYLVGLKINKLANLQSNTIKFVSANAQASFYVKLNEENFFNEEEIAVFKRGRNFKSMSAPKNTDIQIYRISTGFEALIGYLYVGKHDERLRQLWDKIKTLVEV